MCFFFWAKAPRTMPARSLRGVELVTHVMSQWSRVVLLGSESSSVCMAELVPSQGLPLLSSTLMSQIALDPVALL